MSESKTPETDNVTFRILSNLQSGTDAVVYAEHARRLESERNALREALRTLDALQRETNEFRWGESAEKDGALRLRWVAAWKAARALLGGEGAG